MYILIYLLKKNQRIYRQMNIFVKNIWIYLNIQIFATPCFRIQVGGFPERDGGRRTEDGQKYIIGCWLSPAADDPTGDPIEEESHPSWVSSACQPSSRLQSGAISIKDKYTNVSRRQAKVGKLPQTILYWTQGFPSVCADFVTLMLPPLDSETGGTGELWLTTNHLDWKSIILFFFGKKRERKKI